MKRIILTVLAAALFSASSAEIASAAGRHHVRKMDRAPVVEQFRNANNALAWPAGSGGYTSYADGHAISAPAGR